MIARPAPLVFELARLTALVALAVLTITVAYPFVLSLAAAAAR